MWPGGVWIEHRVIDHELVAPFKHIAQRHLAILALERVVLVHQLPGKLAALATQLIAQMRELFFLRQVLLASCDPLVVGHHLVSYHPTFSQIFEVNRNGLSCPKLYQELKPIGCSIAADAVYVQLFSCRPMPGGRRGGP